MKVKIFTQSPDKKFLGPEFVPTALETDINAWFATHPTAQVHYVKHDVVTGFGVKALLIVSLYYAESASA